MLRVFNRLLRNWLKVTFRFPVACLTASQRRARRRYGVEARCHPSALAFGLRLNEEVVSSQFLTLTPKIRDEGSGEGN